MGFALSWIAVKGASKDQVLAWMNLADTGEKDEAMEAPFCGAQLPGWYVVVANGELGFAKEENLFNLSRDCEALGCVVEEHVMTSQVVCYKDASFVWRVEYFGESGPDEAALDSEGPVPPQWAAIREAHIAAQKGGGNDVDHHFDAPLELARALCGFRHDLGEYDWGLIEFTVLTGAAPSAPPPGKAGGWMKKLFGG